MKGIFSILTVLFMVFGLTVSAHADPFAYASARVGSFDTGTWNSVVGNSSASAYSGTQNGVASAEIYLASGFLSTYATSSKEASNWADEDSRAVAIAQGWDNFTLSAPGGIVHFVITASLFVSGKLEQDLQSPWTQTSIVAGFHRSPSFEWWNDPHAPPYFYSYGDGGLGYEEVDILLSREYDVVSGIPFGLSFTLYAYVQGKAGVDFSNTATLSFDLPEGTSISSEGGFFQSATPVPEPIPEPTTMLLLGSGLIGLAGYGRKKLFRK